jgi:divalent anion:Na+ symporter, DASS family
MSTAIAASASGTAGVSTASASGGQRSVWLPRTALAVIAVGVWFMPPPDGLTVQAWRLFTIFAAAIVSVVVSIVPILTASVIAVATAVLTGILAPAKAYAGFANGTILLIVLAFLVARAVVKCGLGTRLGHLVVSLFGRSTLGLSYSIFLVDGLIAPAFPSNTARSGVLYPLAYSLASAGGALAADGSRRRVGVLLMFSGMVSLSLSSALWLTAMAANPLGTEIARSFGVEIAFGSWLAAACVPTLAAIGLMPLLLRALIAPEINATPEAPAAARKALAALGPLTRDERIVLAAFVGMIALWASAATFKIDSTAVAFLGLGVLLVSGVLTLEDIAKEGDVLATFIWFAVLFTLSSQLNELGFMGYLGQRLAGSLAGLSPGLAGLALVIAYVALHYVFVSQTAHMLALFGVFLDVGIRLGVPAAPLAFQLLFATNYFAAITPQGSSANLLFVGSGLLSQRDLYRLGAVITACQMAIFLVVGTPWLMLVWR